MDLNAFAKEVHQNAVEHGWWEENRDELELLALIHSEWSEALEEYRAGRPMVWYSCALHGTLPEAEECADVEMVDGAAVCNAEKHECPIRLRKPEGIAIELMDGVIRILDFLGRRELYFGAKLNSCLVNVPERFVQMELPSLVGTLHALTSEYAHVVITDKIPNKPGGMYCGLSSAIFYACAWVRAQGFDPEKLLLEKHAYNRTRPWRHGGKKC